MHIYPGNISCHPCQDIYGNFFVYDLQLFQRSDWLSWQSSMTSIRDCSLRSPKRKASYPFPGFLRFLDLPIGRIITSLTERAKERRRNLAGKELSSFSSMPSFPWYTFMATSWINLNFATGQLHFLKNSRLKIMPWSEDGKAWMFILPMRWRRKDCSN